METSRRDRFATHRAPSTWEIPTVVALVGVAVVLGTPLLVQGLVASLTSGDFAWPTDLAAAYGELARGRFGAGLARDPRLPADGVMWLLTAFGEALTISAAIWAGLRMRRLTNHGLATAAQAVEALGVQRLRASAPQIRPDLQVAKRRHR